MTNPAPSWYPDPENPNQLRWWDGEQWTDQFRPLDAASQGPAAFQQTTVIPSVEQTPPQATPPPGMAPGGAQPYAQTAAGPGSSGGGNKGLLYAGLGVLVALLAGGAIFALTRGDDDETATTGTTTTVGDETIVEPTTTESTAPETSETTVETTETTVETTEAPTTEAPVTTVAIDPTWSVVDSETFSIGLPPNYLVLDDATAQQLLEETAADSAFVENALATIDQNDIALLAIDQDTLSSTFVDNLNILATDTGTPITLDALEAVNLQNLEEGGVDLATIDVSRATVGTYEAVKVIYPASVFGADQVQYLIPNGTTVITATFSFSEGSLNEAFAESVITTLQIK